MGRIYIFSKTGTNVVSYSIDFGWYLRSPSTVIFLVGLNSILKTILIGFENPVAVYCIRELSASKPQSQVPVFPFNILSSD